MKIDATLERLVAAAQSAHRSDHVGSDVAVRALPLVDLTSLNDDDTDDRIRDLCLRALTPAGAVAAVCVYPRFVALARRLLDGTGVRIATVVNFPGGRDDAPAVARATRAAVADGADEIDVVTGYGDLLRGERARPFDLLLACREACGDGVAMKVILETGALADADLIEAAGRDAVAAGANFLKTSTGKLQPAATPEAAAVMLAVIRDSGRPVGFKAAGGIRDTATAAVYLALADAVMGAGWATPATFRFGASGLLDALLADLGHAKADPTRSGY